MTPLEELLEKINDLPDFDGLHLVDPAQRGLFNTTPLHVVAIWGDIAAAKLLLDHGADINAQGEYGYTPLHEAVDFEHEELVRFLLQRGADRTIKNIDGLSPQESAPEHLKHLFD